MAHEIDFSNKRANIAWLGDRNDIWHHLGTGMAPGQSVDDWAKAAGLDWHAVKAQAYFKVPSAMEPFGGEMRQVDGDRYIVRSDTLAPLGHATDGYHPVQPREVLDWFQRYIAVDDRFQLDVAGSLKGGAVIWATAKFNGEMDVGGSAHRARLLMTTTFDQTGATINQGTMTRVVCMNTLRAALGDKHGIVRTRHNTRFDGAKVGRELAQIAKSFANFKAIGDAMDTVELANGQISAFFKAILDIPFDAKQDDISTRKMNQFRGLSIAYQQTVMEGTARNKVWTALNAVTRYADHDRSTRQTEGTVETSRFASAQFGSGDQLKSKAWELLMPLVADKVAVAA